MTSSAARSFFASTFGAPPDSVASAPARVNLIGEHTDYNGGEVLPIGIDRRTYVAVRRSRDTITRVASDKLAELGSFHPTTPDKSGKWWDYVAGVVRELSQRILKMPALEIAVVSDVPSGAGLSSSAAISVATALAIGDLLGLDLSLQDAAHVAWSAETLFVGVPCGIMDQFASALAQEHSALHVFCDTMRTEHVRCQEHVLIFDTGVKRGLRTSAFAARRDECARALLGLQKRRPELGRLAHATIGDIEESDLDSLLRRRATHVVTENARVKEAVASLESTATIPGELLVASHESLRDLYECSAPELDWFVEFASAQPGIRGARLTGAGWGGCAIATGEIEALQSMAEPVMTAYGALFPHSARSWLVRPAAGARVES
ncbi:MAG: galactokinase [Gemmatimonadota bacterium]